MLYRYQLQTKTDFTNKKTKVILGIGIASLAISAVLSVYFVQQMNILNSELAEKSRSLDERDEQILEYRSMIASQKQQIDEKASQLVALDSEIKTLESEITSNELEIIAKTRESQELVGTVEAQKTEIQILKGQAARLQDDIQELEDELSEKENEIELLIGKVDETQNQLESFKRKKVSHYSVAVTQDDVGIILPIEVEIIPFGEGIVSIDVRNVQYETGFQDAVRTAIIVASEYSDVSVSDKDVIIRVTNDLDGGLITLDGGSAGALITGMVAAGLMDEQIDPSVLITGTIKSDGTVGRIGGLDEKAEAAIDFGANLLLVPEEQDFESNSIKVVGVSDIRDIMRYFVS